MERTLIIRPLHPPLEWLVESQSRGDTIQHLVKLGENNMIGSCSCEYFQFRLNPIIKTYGSSIVPDDKFRCKHQKQVREAILDTILYEQMIVTGGPDEELINPRVLKEFIDSNFAA